jgi:hypothetical protein
LGGASLLIREKAYFAGLEVLKGFAGCDEQLAEAVVK